MRELLDLDRYPVDRPESPAYSALVAHCRSELAANGMFNLDGFVRQGALERAAAEILPLAERSSHTHQRRHNVYFVDQVPGLPADHPALRQFDTVHHTLCDDQLSGTIVHRIYEWEPLVQFIAQVMEKPALYVMRDPLARLNVMDYRAGEALNWHFDRSQFTTTLLIQAPEQGGEFEYRSNLRTDTDQNYDGVGRMLRGEDPDIRVNPLAGGTLNVFKGKNTLHRVSPVRGSRKRLIAVFSYYDRPGVMFSRDERIGFFGRNA
ncbi:MAG: 2OG-Fe(II) oxygenase [Steroidobacterales bacterium]